MDDRTFAMVMTKGIGAHLTNDEKRAHLADLRRDHLIDQVCVKEILPPKSDDCHDVRVRVERTVQMKRIDLDYFEESEE